MINWIMQRAKEPSSYAAVGVGIVGLGVISGVGELIFIGIALIFKTAWVLLISWIPAFFAFVYMDDDIF